ncbi:hypothetical protein [uncultured Aquincola sp.]|uniref:hypothetical protein n=1 Tax=uncultured Aquincola sp. TaxID=886556 RepID=UPI0032B2D206
MALTPDDAAHLAAERALLVVKLLDAPREGQAGRVLVTVPQELVRQSGGFSFDLPDELQQPLREGAPHSVNTADGGPLPVWLRLVAANGRFVAERVPQQGLPLELLIVINGQRSALVIQWQKASRH